MPQTLISFGANLGNSRQLIQLAGEQVVGRFGRKNVRFSQMYRAPAVGGPAGQADFYNAIASIESKLTAYEVWQILQTIEHDLGRSRRLRWEARRIDLDVLLHDQERHWTPTLKVPHPRMFIRTFVMEPATEIAAEWFDPITGQTLEQLRDELRVLSGPNAPTPCVTILAEQTGILDSLETSFDRSYKSSSNSRMERLVVPTVSRSASRRSLLEMRAAIAKRFNTIANQSVNLIVYAGTTPDPASVHWEDYGRVWADLLGMNSRLRIEEIETSQEELRFRKIPKYLLSVDNPEWAVHELKAALTAMTCPIQADGNFFDDR
jgi:2-amino-4-hydroxy-6-hydroxymethyldihydropteridine diphosphokinase